MKRKYSAPVIEVENLSLTTAIASCGLIISFGPPVAAAPWEVCEKDFEIGETDLYSARAAISTSFTDDKEVCDCYYYAGNEGYFTS